MPDDSVTRIDPETVDLAQLIVSHRRAIGDDKTQVKDVVHEALMNLSGEVLGHENQ